MNRLRWLAGQLLLGALGAIPAFGFTVALTCLLEWLGEAL